MNHLIYKYSKIKNNKKAKSSIDESIVVLLSFSD